MNDSKRFFPVVALLFALLVTVFPAPVAAKEKFVTDSFTITMRRGNDSSYAILRMLKTGTPLTILEAEEGSDWIKVRTRGGAEGWVLARFLVEEKPARSRVDVAEAAMKQAEKKSELLEKRFKEISNKVTRLGQLEKEVASLKELSRNAAALESQNKSFNQELQTLRVERDQAVKERDWLKGWYLQLGAFLATFILGMLSGAVLSRGGRKPTDGIIS